LDESIFGNEGKSPREMYICADELYEFTGSANGEFYGTLGNLWDWDNEDIPFSSKYKNSKSVSIYQPTVNLLGGTTPDLFAKIFPADVIGTGFLSRLILIHGDRSERKITFPTGISNFTKFQIVSFFQRINSIQLGEIKITESGRELLTNIYTQSLPLVDVRFQTYSERRFTHLLKLCIIICIARWGAQIDYEHIIEANTILTHAEFLMPKALGEFGKSKNSDVTSKIMTLLEGAMAPMSTKEIWKFVQRDLDTQTTMMHILSGLIHGEKIHVVKHYGKTGYLPLKAERPKMKYVDWKYLSREELDLAGVME
jgi:hypothetical protein